MKARYVQYFDQDLLYSQQCLTQEAQISFLERTQEECHHYAYSVMLFNLDSLANFSQNENISGFGNPEGPSYTRQQTQNKLLNKVFDFFCDAANENDAIERDNKRRWVSKFPSHATEAERKA